MLLTTETNKPIASDSPDLFVSFLKQHTDINAYL